jgi:hypothetical protein
MAFGSKEHPGRVRGCGQGATIKKVFRTSRQCHYKGMTDAEMDAKLDAKINAMKDVWRVQMREELMNDVMHEISKKYLMQPLPPHEEVNEVRQPCPPPNSEYDSCTISKHLSEISGVIFFIVSNLF